MSVTFSNYRLWMLAIRPKTLPAAAGPILVGFGLACSVTGYRREMLWPSLVCFLASILLQIGVNLANDYFDFVNNIDSENRQGPVRVTQSGLIPPSSVKMGMIVSLLCAGLVLIYLTTITNWQMAIVGAVSLLAALAYSGGPWPLASHGLGEVFVFIFFGWIGVGGTYFALTGDCNWQVFWAAFPPGLLISAIMVVNNFRDITTDRKAGKLTLAVRLGHSPTKRLYKIFIYCPYLVPVLFVVMEWASGLVLLPLSTILLARKFSNQLEDAEGAGLNQLLASTAKLSLLFCLLFSFGLCCHF